MSVLFTLDEEGYLDWRTQGEGAPDLNIEEARVMAQAEIAAALRQIASELSGLARKMCK